MAPRDAAIDVMLDRKPSGLERIEMSANRGFRHAAFMGEILHANPSAGPTRLKQRKDEACEGILVQGRQPLPVHVSPSMK
jgi:hypothetical protein